MAVRVKKIKRIGIKTDAGSEKKTGLAGEKLHRKPMLFGVMGLIICLALVSAVLVKS